MHVKRGVGGEKLLRNPKHDTSKEVYSISQLRYNGQCIGMCSRQVMQYPYCTIASLHDMVEVFERLLGYERLLIQQCYSQSLGGSAHRLWTTHSHSHVRRVACGVCRPSAISICSQRHTDDRSQESMDASILHGTAGAATAKIMTS
jgi:hypothetical protein